MMDKVLLAISNDAHAEEAEAATPTETAPVAEVVTTSTEATPVAEAGGASAPVSEAPAAPATTPTEGEAAAPVEGSEEVQTTEEALAENVSVAVSTQNWIIAGFLSAALLIAVLVKVFKK